MGRGDRLEGERVGIACACAAESREENLHWDSAAVNGTVYVCFLSKHIC